MSAGVEDSGRPDVPRRSSGTGLASGPEGPDEPLAVVETVAPTRTPSQTESPGPVVVTIGKQHHHHHVLIEPEEDRWAWRRRIRQNPHKLRIYRVAVALAGLLLICLGLVTGPLPGPGGIPLVLLGLAIWSSEFEWAYRLRQRFKAQVRRYRGWTGHRKVIFWIAFFAVCGALGYLYLVVLGVPFWVPDAGASLVEHLPGVKPHG